MSSSNKQSEEISNAEAELYDRQIRLWGLEAQNRFVLQVIFCQRELDYIEKYFENFYI